ncbi:MAG: hypothetical protein AB1941_30760 [Gemmatimonadota bacterium]
MKRLVVVATAALLAGCASSGNAPAETVRSTVSVSGTDGAATQTIESYMDVGGTTHRISATPDKVWAVLPTVYQGLGITVGTSLPDYKTIGNSKLELNRTLGGQPLSTFLSCGDGPTGAPIANSYRVNMAVVTTVAPAAGGGSQLETRVNASATNRAVSGAAVNCATTGRLEGMIAERVRNQAM